MIVPITPTTKPTTTVRTVLPSRTRRSARGQAIGRTPGGHATSPWPTTGRPRRAAGARATPVAERVAADQGRVVVDRLHGLHLRRVRTERGEDLRRAPAARRPAGRRWSSGTRDGRQRSVGVGDAQAGARRADVAREGRVSRAQRAARPGRRRAAAGSARRARRPAVSPRGRGRGRDGRSRRRVRRSRRRPRAESAGRQRAARAASSTSTPTNARGGTSSESPACPVPTHAMPESSNRSTGRTRHLVEEDVVVHAERRQRGGELARPVRGQRGTVALEVRERTR